MIEFSDPPEYQKLLSKARSELGLNPSDETHMGALKMMLRLNDKIKKLENQIETVIRLNDLRQHG